MEGITNEESEWDHNVEGDVLESQVVCVCREEVLQAPSEVSLELIAASGRVGNLEMAEICLRFLDGFGMPVEWALNIVVTIFKWKGNICSCRCF